MLEWLWMLLAGLGAGFVSGLLGVGGGIVLVPALHYLLGFAWHEAVALSLLVIAVQAPLGIRLHARRGAVDRKMLIPLVLGGAAGVALGIYLEPRIGVPFLKLAFASLMGFAAYRLVARPPEPRTTAHPWPVLAAMGFGAGVVARLLGVGGGIVTVPLLTLTGVPVHIAVGTSLVPVWTNAAVATVVNAFSGLPWLSGLLIAAGALGGTILGVRAAHALPGTGLRQVVAAALLVSAVLVAVNSGVLV